MSDTTLVELKSVERKAFNDGWHVKGKASFGASVELNERRFTLEPGYGASTYMAFS